MLHVVPALDDTVFHWIGDLEHGARDGGFVAAHDVFEFDAFEGLFFGAEDGAADNGGILVVGEILYMFFSMANCVNVWYGMPYSASISSFEEAGPSIEDY
jgi:hypothetical protein